MQALLRVSLVTHGLYLICFFSFVDGGFQFPLLPL
jgi:hypothetical protein